MVLNVLLNYVFDIDKVFWVGIVYCLDKDMIGFMVVVKILLV